MAVGYADTGTATAFGYAAGGFNAAQAGTGRGGAFGYAALGIRPDPAAGTAPDAVRLEVLTASGTQLINDLAARRNLTFSVEHNGSGSVSFDTDLDALPAGVVFDPDHPSNLVRVHFGDLPNWPYGVAEGVPMAAPPVKNDTGWSVQVSGPGSWDLLDFGVLWPPAGAVGDTREFSYTAGQTGLAWVPEEWSTPSGYLVKNSFRWAKRYPRGWPESKARWIWSSSPEKNSAEGTRQFVGTPFTLTSPKHVHFYAAGDDNLKLYLNGARIKTKRRGGWKRTASFIRLLPAGTYVVAAAVANMPGGDNKSGFIFAAAQLKADGSRDHWLLRSNSNTFQVKIGDSQLGTVPLPPDGWFPAAVLYSHVLEAQARGVDFHPSITLTFNNLVDSNGTSWTVKGQAEYDIGISGAELGEKVRSSGADVAMLPGLRLAAWRERGFDLRSRVVISLPTDAGWGSRGWPRVRTVALTHQESGWTETVGTTGAFGRRELTVSGGGTDGDLQAGALAADALRTAGDPEETIEITYSSATPNTPVPFRDYGPADTISVETVNGYTPVKVMSITGAEQDNKEMRWTISGYPV